MILIKSPSQIDKIAKSGALLNAIFVQLESLIKPGISLLEIDCFIEQFMLKSGGKPMFKGYNGFPNASCLSVNNVLIHGVPTKYVLVEGDILSVDIGVSIDGFIADAARTYAVGKISNDAKKLIDVTKDALDQVIRMLKPGVRVGDIGALVASLITKHGYQTTSDYSGHGVGRFLHEDPAIPNRGIAGTGAVLKEGMVIAIEPMVIGGNSDLLLVDNHEVKSPKYLCAHFEDTIAIVKDGAIVLTRPEVI